MSIGIANAIKNGVSNAVSKNGAIFVALFTAIYLLYDIALDTILAGLGEPQTGLAITANVGLGVSLAVMYLISMIYVTLVLLRTFAAEETSHVPESIYKENLLLPAINLTVASIIFTLLVGIGALMLVIPGIFLLVALYFYSFEVAVRDKNSIQALKGSYGLTKGNRIELFALGVTVVLASFVIGLFTLPFLIFAELGGTGVALVSMIVHNLFLAILIVGGFSIAAQAYNQLLAMEE